MTVGLAGVLTRAATLVQAAPLVPIAIAGIIAGSVGSVLASGRGTPAAAGSPSEPLPLFACPDGKTRIGEVQPGEQVLVTARSTDDAWLQVHFPMGAQDRAWAEKTAFTLEGDAGALPTASCDTARDDPAAPVASLSIAGLYSPSPAPSRRPTPIPSPTVAPTATPIPTPTARATATRRPTATPRTTTAATAPPGTVAPTPTAVPTPTPVPTPIPDTTGPTVPTWYTNYATIYVCTQPNTVTFYATAADPSGVRFMRLYYDPPGATYGSTYQLMTRYAGSVYNGSWSLSVTSNLGWASGTMYWYVQAYDWPGNVGWSAYQKYVTIVNDSSNCIH